MDTTKDIVDEEENNNVDVATEQPNVNNNTSSNISSGLQQIEDDSSDLPLPNGMAEVISNRAEPPKQKIGKVEQIDDDDLGPEPPAAMLEASLNAADITNKIAASSSAALKGSESVDMKSSSELAAYLTEALQSGRINNIKEAQDILDSFKDTSTTATSTAEYTNELSPPVPFNSAQFEDAKDTIAKKKAKEEMMNQKPPAVEVLPPSNRDSIYEPPREIIEGGEGMPDNTNTGRGDTNRRGWEDIESRVARRDIESQTRTNVEEDTGDSINNDSIVDTEANVVPSSTNQERLPEIEAYLVEDVEEEVFIATPTLPWWKQRRTRILLCVVFFLLVLMAIAITVAFSQPNPENTVFLNGTNVPTLSLAPSSSSAPSSSPTECVNKIISNKQEIDLVKDLQINDPRQPKVTVDGSNMVVVALDGKYYTINAFGSRVYDGPVFITFYSLDNNNEWQRIQTPIRVDDVSSDGDVRYSVSLSGSAAFIGFPYANDEAGTVLEYKQNDFDEWVRVDDPFVHITNTTKSYFGGSVAIDGDLACVYSNGMNLYHREDNSKWVQFDTIEGGYICSISGDTIAIPVLNWDSEDTSIQLYSYNQDQNKIVPIQDPIPVYSNMDLNNDYLIYWDYDYEKEESSAFIYHRNETNQTFTLIQQLNITGPWENSLSLDNDILVVGGYNHTHIHSLKDGSWVESITLNESFDDYKISGRTLLATKNNETSFTSEVYSYNIQECAQDMPTQSPTLSPSLPPTVSSLPTITNGCFRADEGGRDGVLYNAVRAYVDQDCANNEECDIAQVYGWPMNSWCVRHVKDVSYLFQGMNTFNEDISDWNTSSVTDMGWMFNGASSFNRDLSTFDTSSVTNMYGMFWRATSFNQDISNFNTSSITDMSYMFYYAKSFNGDVSNFDTSTVTNMGGMFNVATSFNQDLSNFNTSSVTNMLGMFYDASSFNGDVSNFDTSSVTDMRNMFWGASSFNQDLSNFDTSSVTTMNGMFQGATSFNGDVSNFNTSSVTDMSYMFLGASSFNQDVSNCDTSKVTNMHSMFRAASSFNKDLSNFDTSRVTNMGWMFQGATSFNGDVSNFNTSSVIGMFSMFWDAISFNQDVSSFDTSSVTNMNRMFRGATSFNGDLSSFNTSSVTSMEDMFKDATSFNQDLCSWQDNFPYTNAADIFLESNCTYQYTPNETLKGPFCASDCQ